MDTATAETMRQLLGDKWYGLIMLAVAICSMLATILPKPDTTSGAGRIYAPLYGIIQLLACNWGNAKNASQPNVGSIGSRLGVILLLCFIPLATACNKQAESTPPDLQALAVADHVTTVYEALHTEYLLLHEALPDKRPMLEQKVAPVLDDARHVVIILRQSASAWVHHKQKPGDWQATLQRSMAVITDAARLIAALKEG